MVQVDQIFTVHSLEHKEFRPVGISNLPCMAPELQAFIFCACQKCYDLIWKFQAFKLQKL
jgi:hypothetical protein